MVLPPRGATDGAKYANSRIFKNFLLYSHMLGKTECTVMMAYTKIVKFKALAQAVGLSQYEWIFSSLKFIFCEQNCP